MSNRRQLANVTWRLPRYKRVWKNICAMLPVYLQDGTNGTVVYYIDGSTEQIGHRLEWVLNDLLKYLCTGKDILQQKANDYMESKNGRRIPLVVNQEMCLVPVKGRKAFTKNDGASGYVVLEYVESIQRTYSDESLSRTVSRKARAQQMKLQQKQAELEQDGKTMVYLSRNWEIAVYDSIHVLHQNLNLGAALKYRFGQGV